MTLSHIRKGVDSGRLLLSDREKDWLERLSEQVDQLPGDLDAFTRGIIGECEKLDPKKYDM
ncbi:hypothetical protein SDC9_190170 [bioreactor metagenome]|uniref:Uncharacterized protein n=1 Tax=bioreactor metagenome TaxID=1076179 RepID=A0A645I565_9ZZZZ